MKPSLKIESLKKLLLFVVLILVISSCKSKKTAQPSKTRTSKTVKTSKRTNSQADKIVAYAKTFRGTPYKYGGNTKRGIDCSGLTHLRFKAFNIDIPRTTTELKTKGKWIDVKKVEVGDLLFFATRKNSRKINHVGIVTSARPGHVEFIHSSSSKGVIVSSLAQKYWYFAFVQARRVL